MIELAPDLMAALQAEADRQGTTVLEIAGKAIKEWIEPEPWFDINEPMEPAHTKCSSRHTAAGLTGGRGAPEGDAGRRAWGRF